MELEKYTFSFLGPIILKQPSGRLRKPMHEAEHNEYWQALESERSSPLIVRSRVIEIESCSDPGCYTIAKEQCSAVAVYKHASVFGRSHLGHPDWNRS